MNKACALYHCVVVHDFMQQETFEQDIIMGILKKYPQ